MNLRDICKNKSRARRIMAHVRKAQHRARYPDRRQELSEAVSKLERGVDDPLARSKPITNRWMVGAR